MKLDNRTLLIISHTEHYKNAQGEIVGWVPTVRELDFLAGRFKKVIHLAVLEKKEAPPSAIPYTAKNVEFLSIPSFGGPGIGNKLKILMVIPILLHQLRSAMKVADLFQFRTPTSIGVFLIPVLSLFYKKPGWYKYAGNWAQKDKPASYALQKWMLEKGQGRPVTINGNWAKQKSHVHTFENPCMNDDELIGFRTVGEQKEMSKPLVGCFVGRLEDPKGVGRILDYLESNNAQESIKEFHFVGDGEQRAEYEKRAKTSKVPIRFYGFANRETTFEVYTKSDLFFLPSTASEGFPKVIAEAAAFGCVPVVSNVSSIGQYIIDENGYVWNPEQLDFTAFMQQLDFAQANLKKKQNHIFSVAELFTFEAYLKKLETFVFPTILTS